MNHESAIDVMYGGFLVFIDQIHDGRGFSSTRRTVQQQVGEVPRCNDVAHDEFVQRVKHNVVKFGWTIFFNPRGGIGRAGRIECIGGGHFQIANGSKRLTV